MKTKKAVRLKLKATKQQANQAGNGSFHNTSHAVPDILAAANAVLADGTPASA